MDVPRPRVHTALEPRWTGLVVVDMRRTPVEFDDGCVAILAGIDRTTGGPDATARRGET